MTKDNTKTDIAIIRTKLENIESEIKDIKKKLELDYITKIEFYAKVTPLERIVYGLVALVLIGFASAVINFFLIR